VHLGSLQIHTLAPGPTH
jgi:hypothetical protein